ncbi:MAG: hypothetical protein ACYTG0_14585 [Planctomycetota bacterium]
MPADGDEPVEHGADAELDFLELAAVVGRYGPEQTPVFAGKQIRLPGLSA